MNQDATVGPMRKISLALKAKDPARLNAPGPGPATFEFIFGIGTEGMCAFEQTLFGKTVGQTLTIEVSPHSMQSYFEHLLCPVMESIGQHPPFSLNIEIQAIHTASDRELVKALAQKGGGCEGDCGCGCGG
jgi:hypothetical protein